MFYWKTLIRLPMGVFLTVTPNLPYIHKYWSPQTYYFENLQVLVLLIYVVFAFQCWDWTQRLLNADSHSSIYCPLNPWETLVGQPQNDRVSGCHLQNRTGDWVGRRSPSMVISCHEAYVCVCMCMHVCVCICLCKHMLSICTHMKARIGHEASWSNCSQLPCMRVSRWTGNLSFSIGWLTSKLLGVSSLSPPRLGVLNSISSHGFSWGS